MKRKYRHINSKTKYKKLLESGMFWEMHPELTGDWSKDKYKIGHTKLERK